MPRPAPPLHLALWAEGQAAAGLPAIPGELSGALALELGLAERWGLLARLQLGSGLSQTLGPGTVTVSRQAAALLARARLHPIDRPQSALRLQAGPLLERLDARGQGFSANAQATVYNPGLALGARWEERPGASLALEIGPEIGLLARATRFQVDGVSGAVQSPRVWAGLVLGAGWDFF